MISPSLSGGWSLRLGFGMLASEISSAGFKGRMLQSQAILELLRILYPILTSLAKISTHGSYFAGRLRLYFQFARVAQVASGRAWPAGSAYPGSDT